MLPTASIATRWLMIGVPIRLPNVPTLLQCRLVYRLLSSYLYVQHFASPFTSLVRLSRFLASAFFNNWYYQVAAWQGRNNVALMSFFTIGLIAIYAAVYHRVFADAIDDSLDEYRRKGDLLHHISFRKRL